VYHLLLESQSSSGKEEDKILTELGQLNLFKKLFILLSCILILGTKSERSPVCFIARLTGISK